MSQQRIHELGSILYGTITAAGLGSFLFQALGAVILGLMGALGGYLFAKFIKPKLDKIFRKKGSKA